MSILISTCALCSCVTSQTDHSWIHFKESLTDFKKYSLFRFMPKSDYYVLTYLTEPNSGGNTPELKITTARELGVKMPKRPLCFYNACLITST